MVLHSELGLWNWILPIGALLMTRDANQTAPISGNQRRIVVEDLSISDNDAGHQVTLERMICLMFVVSLPTRQYSTQRYKLCSQKAPVVTRIPEMRPRTN